MCNLQTNIYQELALLSDRMFPEETDKIERYVGGMPDSIYSSVVASKPKTMQEAIEMGTTAPSGKGTRIREKVPVAQGLCSGSCRAKPRQQRCDG
ncbi:hypothetical protein Tco_1577345 [Tanacetum coccineum]